MGKYPVQVEGTQNMHFKYILVILDVFSRFLLLRTLKSKWSAEVASILLQVFSDIGPPLRVQSDQGTEFKGVVHTLMSTLGVQIIHINPYHPQSQGKVSLYSFFTKTSNLDLIRLKSWIAEQSWLIIIVLSDSVLISINFNWLVFTMQVDKTQTKEDSSILLAFNTDCCMWLWSISNHGPLPHG